MQLIDYLLSINLDQLSIGLIFIFFTLEHVLNTQFAFKGRGMHMWQNFLFMVVFLIINMVWAAFFVSVIEWLNQREIGLFYLIQIPVWSKLILAVVLLDLATYWFHRLSHRVPVIWRFHRVHHSDTTLDASTYFRSHPVEIFLWFGSAPIMLSALFGFNLMDIGLFYFVIAIFQIIEHSNLRFPSRLDKTVGLIFTTPNLHKIHHDQDQNYTDSNYADIFILWDRLFGTYQYKPVEQIKFGLPEFDQPKRQTFWYLIRSPFILVKNREKDA